MNVVVIDASCMVARLWETPDVGVWLDENILIAPTIFWDEMVNTGLVMARKGRITIDQAQVGLWESMQTVNPTHAATPPVVLDLAHDTGLSAYDANYLANAVALSLPLATFDNKLRKAAADLGVVTLP